MGAFDTLALFDKAFGDGVIAKFNAKLHESKVYNFQVEEYHTYCVGEDGIWVHNSEKYSSGVGDPVQDNRVPDKARKVADDIKNNNGTPPEGYKGGRTYKNEPINPGDQKLPEGVNYKEYDVNPYIKGQNRGPERLVIGDDSSTYYTADHYHSFTKID